MWLEGLSPNFKTKFTTPLKDINTDVVELKGCNKGSVESFIEMACSNQLKIDVMYVQGITFVANYLLI